MLQRKEPIIAIDGPAGAGKSTIARMVAERLNYRYIDTGAMYRTVTLKAMQEKVDLTNAREVEAIALKTNMTFAPGSTNKVLLDNKDVSHAIRTPEVTRNVSAYVANYPGVRKALVGLQQLMGKSGGVVMEGRDITTVVFPDAEIKIYLDASQEERAKRRYAELKAKGQEQPFDELLKDLTKRDKEDLERPGGALQKTADAHHVDTTGLTIEQVVENIVGVVESNSHKNP